MILSPETGAFDIFWLRDKSQEESDNLSEPDILAQEIVDDLEAGLEQFREIGRDLGADVLILDHRL